MHRTRSRTPGASAGYPAAVVVTGASSGIGRACALRLARAGFHVFAGVRKEEDARDLEGEVPEGRIMPLLLDVTNPEVLVSATKRVEEATGDAGPTELVNNAGVGMTGPLELIDRNGVVRQFEVNVFGQLAVTQAFLPLIRAGEGRVVNIGSVGGWSTMPSGGHFAAAEEPDLLARDIAAFFAGP